MTINPNHAGNIAEAGFVFHAIRAEIPVLLPATEHGAYDAALEIGGRIVRVQIKSGALSADGRVVTAGLRRSRHTPNSGYVTSNYSADEVDAFGIYCPGLDRSFLIKMDATRGCGTVRLRLDQPRNGQRASVRFAADYEFPGAVAQLGEHLAGSEGVRGSSPLSSTPGPDREAAFTTVGAHEFRERFGWYLERAAAGETIDVTRHGKGHVRLSPIEPRLPAEPGEATEAA